MASDLPLAGEALDKDYARKSALAQRAVQLWAVEDLLTGMTAKRLNAICAEGGFIYDVKPIGTGERCLVVWYRFEE